MRSPSQAGPFQSPPTSAHGELVEPSATVLRQAQDERVVNFHNFEKALRLKARLGRPIYDARVPVPETAGREMPIGRFPPRQLADSGAPVD